MITMTNVLKRGRTVWDRNLLPEDEYVERVDAVRAAMVAAGLDAAVLFGHSTHTGNFTYLSGSVPPLGWMSVVLGREAGPILVSGGGSREIPFLSTQTWIGDIRTSSSLFAGPAAVVGGTLAEIVQPGGRVGLVGAAEELAPRAHREMLAALEAYEVVAADDLIAGLRAVKRPRELQALRRSLAVARAAAAAATDAWADGAGSADALLAAERAARLGGARDVRVLGTLDGEELSPVEAHSDARGDRLALYCAVEVIGYWAQVCAEAGPGTGEGGAAERAVEAMVAASAAGVPATALVDAATAVLPGGRDDVAFSYGLGGGIGLDLSEPPHLAAGSDDILPGGAVLALQAITLDHGRLRCASETVLIDEAGATVL